MTAADQAEAVAQWLHDQGDPIEEADVWTTGQRIAAYDAAGIAWDYKAGGYWRPAWAAVMDHLQELKDNEPRVCQACFARTAAAGHTLCGACG